MNKELAVASYNIMFGGNGRNPFLNLWHHARVHFGKDKNYAANLNLTPVIKTIEKVFPDGPDILYLQEMYGHEQFLMLADLLHKEFGYPYINEFPGCPLTGTKVAMTSLIATKEESKAEDFGLGRCRSGVGNGGGAGKVTFSAFPLTVYAAHFPFPRKPDLYKTYRDKLFASEFKRFTLMVGDFNLNFNELNKIAPDSESLKCFTVGEPTCSLTPVIKWICSKCLDYIMGTKDIELIESGYSKDVSSDHALIWAKIKLTYA